MPSATGVQGQLSLNGGSPLIAYSSSETMTGTKITDILTHAHVMSAHCHRRAIDQYNTIEFWYLRDSVWSLFPEAHQPFTTQSDHPTVTMQYRQNNQLNVTLPNGNGQISPENRNSPLNYNVDGFDPLVDEARKVKLRVGALCFENLASGLTPTTAHAVASGALVYMGDDTESDYSTSLDLTSFAGFTLNGTMQLEYDLSSVQFIRHTLLRFGSKTQDSLFLPDWMQVEVSRNGTDWTTLPRVPIGGDGDASNSVGDWDDSYYGIGVECCVCDIHEYGRYVRVTISTNTSRYIGIDEWAVYGGFNGTPLGKTVFTGYLGDTIKVNPDHSINLTAIGVTKKLADNNEARLTAPYTWKDAGDIVYSLLTSTAYWKGSSDYSTPFTSGEIGWTTASNPTGLTYPLWQGQSNSIEGYVLELFNSIGWVFYDDGDGTFRIFEPPYKQTSPDRQFGNGDGTCYDVRNCTRHRSAKDMRNVIEVTTGKSLSAADGGGSGARFEPNSVGRYGPRRMIITDPLVSTPQLRGQVGGYVLRDYAWRIQTLECEIQPDFDTRIRTIHSFRAPADPNLYSRQGDVAGDLRSNETWTLESIEHHYMVGKWYGNASYIPYFPFGSDPPTFDSLSTTNAVANLILNWTSSTDPLADKINVYKSATNAETGFGRVRQVLNSQVALTLTNPPTPGITIGDRYWMYLTTVNKAGFESTPSIVLNVIAGDAVSAGDDCNANGSGSGYVITDFTVSLLNPPTGPDEHGMYTYECYGVWTAPLCGNTQNHFHAAVVSLPGSPDDEANWTYYQGYWWAADRIPAGMEWDMVTPGTLNWNLTLQLPFLVASGDKIYWRIWNSTRTRAYIPVPGNYDFVTIP